MKKWIVGGGSLIIAVIIVAIVLAVLNLGDIIKAATETYGPKITKTEVKLGSADISILSGSGELNDFLLGNPKGFSMPSALECKTIRVKVVTDSLTSDKIIIEEVFIDGPIISYEKKGRTDNFKTILNNINKTVAGEKKQDKGATSETGSEKKIQINNFIVKNGKINLAGPMAKAFGDESMGIDLPDIHLKDIGKDKDTTPAEAFALVLKEMTGDIAGTVVQVGKKLQEGLNKAMDSMGEGSKSIGDTIKGIFE